MSITNSHFEWHSQIQHKQNSSELYGRTLEQYLEPYTEAIEKYPELIPFLEMHIAGWQKKLSISKLEPELNTTQNPPDYLIITQSPYQYPNTMWVDVVREIQNLLTETNYWLGCCSFNSQTFHFSDMSEVESFFKATSTSTSQVNIVTVPGDVRIVKPCYEKDGTPTPISLGYGCKVERDKTDLYRIIVPETIIVKFSSISYAMVKLSYSQK